MLNLKKILIKTLNTLPRIAGNYTSYSTWESLFASLPIGLFVTYPSAFNSSIRPDTNSWGLVILGKTNTGYGYGGLWIVLNSNTARLYIGAPTQAKGMVWRAVAYS